ncbi:uncharacterized protein LOC133916700 isoform X2 [Phragmites australis]|uniref:uncharacterized protein LOC133916700 isoform X2 n=1 Tax=Phragmites australis TaxID=29695 RepID=UPI002D770591|nr:uncharacterized protein LOC133916700 isoform X2 [Phragmites australis]
MLFSVLLKNDVIAFRVPPHRVPLPHFPRTSPPASSRRTFASLAPARPHRSLACHRRLLPFHAATEISKVACLLSARPTASIFTRRLLTTGILTPATSSLASPSSVGPASAQAPPRRRCLRTDPPVQCGLRSDSPSSLVSSRPTKGRGQAEPGPAQCPLFSAVVLTNATRLRLVAPPSWDTRRLLHSKCCSVGEGYTKIKEAKDYNEGGTF